MAHSRPGRDGQAACPHRVLAVFEESPPRCYPRARRRPSAGHPSSARLLSLCQSRGRHRGPRAGSRCRPTAAANPKVLATGPLEHHRTEASRTRSPASSTVGAILPNHGPRDSPYLGINRPDRRPDPHHSLARTGWDEAYAVFLWLAPALLRASMALTLFSNAFLRTPLPTVPSTSPSIHPLRFFPSRTTTASKSVVPSGRRVKV